MRVYDDFEKVVSILGKPYFQNETTLLFNMDAVEALKRLPPMFNLTVTSPPYNIGKEYEKHMSINEYVEWSRSWMKSVYDTTLTNGSFWLNVGYTSFPHKGKAVPIPYLIWDKTDFFLIQELIWHYGAGVASRRSLSPRNEKVLWYVKDNDDYTFNLDSIRDPNVKYPNQKKHGKIRVNPLGKNPSDVWDIPKVTSGKNRSSKERVNHPAQTPIELFKRIILAASKPGELVLDPFVGSGTTCVAAQALSRYSIGFDIDSSYLDIAIDRLSTEHVEQTALF